MWNPTQEQLRELQEFVNEAQTTFQKGIEALHLKKFNKSALFFNLSARANDKISDLVKEYNGV